MKNSKYWQNRFKQLESAQNALGKKAFAEVDKQYRSAIRDIEADMDKWYRKFAENNNITMADARKWLAGEGLKEFKWSVQEYIKYGEEHALTGAWARELENASAKFHISRLEALKINIKHSIEKLFAAQHETVTEALGEVFRSGYYHTAFEIQKGFGVGFDVGQINNDYLSKVLSKPWAVDGKNFSERIWGNKEKLINELHTELARNIITGADPQKAIDAISDKLKVSKTNAGRLIMTEEAYFSSAAQKECFNDLGVEEYEIVATLDDRTSSICQDMDGQHFPLKEFEAGVTAPPFHVNCRSTTCPYFGDDFDFGGKRAARDGDGPTYYVPEGMKYSEWKEKFVDGGDKEGLSSGKIGDSNSDSVLELVRDFDYNDKKRINQELKAFSEKYLEIEDEYAYVISPNGKLYEVHGGHGTVDITLAGEEALKSSIVIHNHPGADSDSFSADDFKDYFKYGLKELYVVNRINGKGMQRLGFLGERLDYRQAVLEYDAALDRIRQVALDSGNQIESEKLEIMQELKRTLSGLIFEEVSL